MGLVERIHRRRTLGLRRKNERKKKREKKNK